MKEGLLWYDDSSRTLAAKIAPVIRRYREKFGVDPDTCYIHSSVLDAEQQIGGVRVAPLFTVLRHHFWVGCEERPAVDVRAAAQSLRPSPVQVAEVRQLALMEMEVER